MANGFQGLKGQAIPAMSDEFVTTITERYAELYHAMTGRELARRSYENIDADIESRINNELIKLLPNSN